MEIRSSGIENQNGIRQAQAENVGPSNARRQSPITTRARSMPRVAVVWIHAVAYPRLLSGACSATYVAAPPYSPPSARPWTSRSVTIRMGASQPIDEYVGRRPTANVDAP